MMIGVLSERGWVRSTISTSPPAIASTRDLSASVMGRSYLAAATVPGGPDSLSWALRSSKGPGELEPVLQQVQIHVKALRADRLDLRHDARQVIARDGLADGLGELPDIRHGDAI